MSKEKQMREILFRGKRIDNGEWVEGYLVKLPSAIQIGIDYSPWYIIVPPVDPDDDGGRYNVDPETVGQYTGLTDNNGSKIFEGDIVEGSDFTVEDGGYGVVSFDEGAFEVGGNNIIGTFHENYWGKEFEVIGNIHDNPELLEGGE
jgi:hypothetical protein